MRVRWLLTCLEVLAILTLYPGPCSATDHLGEEDEPLSDDQFTLDSSRVVIQGSTRVIGLAGAFVAIAEGGDGNDYNAAAPAHRRISSFSHVDTALSLDFSFPSWLPGSDVFNGGNFEGSENLGILSLGANVQWGPWGFGFKTTAERYELNNQGDAGFNLRRFSGNFGTAYLLLARSLANQDWSLGLGPIFKGVSLFNSGSSLFDTVGVGAQAGILYRPTGKQFRLGLNAKTPVFLDRPDVSASSDSPQVFIPRRLYEPWELSLGGAFQFGPRQLNPLWLDPRDVTARLMARQRANGKGKSGENARTRARERALAEKLAEKLAERWLRLRRRSLQEFGVLVSAQLTILGPTRDAVGLAPFAQQIVRRTSDEVVFSPRLGAESPVIPGRLMLRAGTYLEPTRFESGDPRAHGTFGFDLKLFEWGVFGLFHPSTGWTLNAAIDGAREYVNTSFGLGNWQ